MRNLHINEINNISGAMDLAGDRLSDNLIDCRNGTCFPATDGGSASSGTRDDGCAGSPGGPGDAPGTGFAGA